MGGITAAFTAQLFIGVSLVIDKLFFGSTGRGRVIPYVFWISVMGGFGMVFFFFGFTMPGAKALCLAFLAGLSFLLMLICYYMVLSIGEATEAIPVVGGFAPLATYIAGNVLSFTPLNPAEYTAFTLLMTGGFILFFTGGHKLSRIIPWTLAAAALTGSTNVLEKLVFRDTANFATGYALMKSFTLMAGLSMLAIPAVRKNIFTESASAPAEKRVLYFANRAAAGIGSLLIFYAIRLEEHPAIVESINGARYVIVFILAFILTTVRPDLIRETVRGRRAFFKAAATLVILLGLTGLGLQRGYESLPVPSVSNVKWGVTFSELMAEHLGIDRDETLRAIITELRPSGIRLVAYWDRIERKPGVYDFRSLDSQMNICREASMPVILVIGRRVPRWPECHIPGWGASDADLMRYLEIIVKRYRGYANLLFWQVENEPYLIFGECPSSDSALLESEASLVRGLDPARKIIMTDGGEFGDWYRASSRCDIFGTTLYRRVHNRVLGQVEYPLTPEFYPLKRDIVRFLTGRKDQEFIVIELGAEPWTSRQIYEMTVNGQLKSFTIDEFRGNIDYAMKARFGTYYLWGVEWWYSLKARHGITEYWNYAIEIMNR